MNKQHKIVSFTDEFDLKNKLLTIRYGWTTFKGQEAYFSITSDVKSSRNGREESGGCQHDLIAKVCPELAYLIKWHLVFESKPLHYLANGKYWLEKGNIEYFKSTVIWGAVKSDKKIPTVKGFKRWAMNRLPKLMEAFQADMAKAGVYEDRS